MVARLVKDMLWRSRWIYAVGTGVLIGFWLLYIAGGGDVLSIAMPGISLVFAAALGPLLAGATMGVRELRHLPISSRDLWRATWVAATVVASGFLLATRILTALLVILFGGTPKVPAETILLSAVYDFAWSGVLLPLLAWLSSVEQVLAERGPLTGSLARHASPAAMVACFAVPILASEALPADLGAFSPSATVVLMGCLAVACAGLIRAPERGVLIATRARTIQNGVLAGDATRRQLADTLHGIPRVIAPHLFATLALVLGSCLALAAYGALTGMDALWFVPQREDLFDPEDIGDRGLTFYVLVPCGVVTMMNGVWTPWARLLKVLPLTAGQINALLLVTPFATWSMLWVIGVALYSIAHGTPATLRLDFAFSLAAVSALAHAGWLRLQGSTAIYWVIASIGGLLPQFVKLGLARDGTAAHVAFLIIGATALCSAALINHRTLAHSTSSSVAYRRQPPPVGLPAAGTR